MAPSTHSADVSQIQADTTAILVDTGTTIPATIATVDGNVDAILVDTGTTIPATIATVDGNVDAILVDTGTTIPATIATVDGNVDSILVDTGTTIPARMGGALAIANSSSNVLAFATGVSVLSGTLDLPYDDAVLFATTCAIGNVTGDAGRYYSTKGGTPQNETNFGITEAKGVNWSYIPLGRFSNGDAWAFYVVCFSGTGYAAAQMTTIFAAEWFPDGAPA